jgi:predicted AlkP superfamily phosphohydrolase/phosphomutase
MRETARTAVVALVACLVATVVCTALMTTLLVAINPTDFSLLGVVELGLVVFLACLVPNAAGTLLLAAIWPAVSRAKRGWFEGHRTAYLASGLLAMNVVWMLWHRLAMVHQWASVRPFITWSGLIQSVMLVLVAAGIIVAAVRLRAGRAGLVGGALSLGAVVVLVAAALAWNAHDESFHRRYRLETIRAAADAPGSLRLEGGEAAATGPVVVLGFDGMCWSTVTPLMEEGLMPNLAGLIRRGAIGYLDNDDLSLSPQIWTTMFTGRSVRNHGIYDYLQLTLPWSSTRVVNLQNMKPATDTIYGIRHILFRLEPFGPWKMTAVGSADRKVPACWEVASHYGKRVVVANAIVNLPVRPVNGAMLKLDQKPQRDPLSVYPPALAEVWNPILPNYATMDAEESFAEAVRALDHEVSFTIDLFREYQADLGIYYTHFLDTFSHLNWDFWARDDFVLAGLPRSLADEEWRKLVSENVADRAFRSHQHADAVIGRFLEHFPTATFIIVSDHGWTYSGYEHFGSPDGVVIVSGPRVRPGVDLDDAHILNVTPTVLALLDVPLSRRFEGDVFSNAFDPELTASFVDAHHMPQPDSADRQDVELDEAESERLRALGYID